MKDTLRKLKLIDTLTTEVEMSRSEFVTKLSAMTDKGDTGFFSDNLNVFSSSKNELKGRVHHAGFELKRRSRMFDTNMNMAVANGTFQDREGHLRIETEINGLHSFFVAFYVLAGIFYAIFILVMIHGEAAIGFFSISFVLLHGLLMLLLPYLLMRRGVKRLKYELEREFFFLTKKQ